MSNFVVVSTFDMMSSSDMVLNVGAVSNRDAI